MLPKATPRAAFLKGPVLAPLLNAKGQAVFKVTGEPRAGKYGLDVAGTIGKAPFVFTLDPDSSNYRVASEAIGLKESDWPGSTLVLGTKVSQKTGNPYVVVLRAEAA